MINNKSRKDEKAKLINSGKFVLNERRAQIDNLDALPMWDRGLIDYKKYHQYVGQSGIRYEMTIQGTRGCPFRCFYCDVQHITPFHRRRSAENIFEEVKYLSSLGVKRIEFIDDAFNVNIKEFKHFFKMIIDSKLDVQFYFQSGLRGDLLDPESIDMMWLGGVKSVNLSLESASPRLQKLMCKNLNIEKLHSNLTYIVEKYPYLIVGLNAMHGFPTETEAEAQITIEFIKDIKSLHFVQLHNVRIFPGSLLEKIALENGVTREQIEESLTLPYHLIPTTIQLDKDFSRRIRLDFVKNYLFNRERLKYILTKQIEVCTEDELMYKYRTVFPTRINTLDDILKLGRLTKDDINWGKMKAEEPCTIRYPQLKEKKKLRKEGDSYKILFLDISQFFSEEITVEIKAVEPPLGHIAIVSYLNEKFGDMIEARICKSGVDFDSVEELCSILDMFEPDLIGMRTMTYYKKFFSFIIQEIRSHGCKAPIIAGGPHPTIVPEQCLRENDIQLVSIGEGEKTWEEIIQRILNNHNKFLSKDMMYHIKGIAFLDDDCRKK